MVRAIVFMLASMIGGASLYAAESAQLDTGQTLYIHYRTSSTATVHAAMSEPTAGSGQYYIADATLVAAGLNADCRSSIFVAGYPFVITAHATSSANPLWGGVTDWDGDSVRTVATQASVDELDPATPLPISQVHVPQSRTWRLIRNGVSCVGDRKIAMHVGESLPFAIDCRDELATNGNLNGFESVSIKSGTVGGVTFGTPGFNQVKGVVKITGVTAGTYTLTGSLTSDDSDGSGEIEGDVVLVVVP